MAPLRKVCPVRVKHRDVVTERLRKKLGARMLLKCEARQPMREGALSPSRRQTGEGQRVDDGDPRHEYTCPGFPKQPRIVAEKSPVFNARISSRALQNAGVGRVGEMVGQGGAHLHRMRTEDAERLCRLCR